MLDLVEGEQNRTQSHTGYEKRIGAVIVIPPKQKAEDLLGKLILAYFLTGNLEKIKRVQDFIDQNVEGWLFRDGDDVFIEKETHFIDVELLGDPLLVFLENLTIGQVFYFEFHLLEKLGLGVVVIFRKMVDEKLERPCFKVLIRFNLLVIHLEIIKISMNFNLSLKQVRQFWGIVF